MRDWPGIVVFVGGVACMVASTILGLYLAREAQVRVFRPEMNTSFTLYDRLGEDRVGPDENLLANVNALMWVVLGLGIGLTLVGLRMIRQPILEDRALSPIGPLVEVFKNPD